MPVLIGTASPANWSFEAPAATGSLSLFGPIFPFDMGDGFLSRVGAAITPITVPEAAGNPTPTYAAVDIPPGIQFDTTTRVISGTPQVPGGGRIRIRATNSEGSDDWTVGYIFQ